MTTLHEKRPSRHFRPQTNDKFSEKREHRRYDLGGQTLQVELWDSKRRQAQPLGYLMDLSAGGVRVRTSQMHLKPDSQIRVRLDLPAYAGISPFVDTNTSEPQPRSEWVGWLAVSRVNAINQNECDIAGRLVDMDEMDRGMLGLYLSTQPLAA